MLNRWIETDGLLDVAQEEGFGVIGFTALAQGLLTGRYLDGVPQDSRAAAGTSFDAGWLTDDMLRRLRALNDIAARRGQTLAQMALAWALRDPASPRWSSAPRAPSSWSRTWRRWRTSTSPPRSWPRSTRTPRRAASTCGGKPVRARWADAGGGAAEVCSGPVRGTEVRRTAWPHRSDGRPMQTFLPYPDFCGSALVLDRKRLGKQRVEALRCCAG